MVFHHDGGTKDMNDWWKGWRGGVQARGTAGQTVARLSAHGRAQLDSQRHARERGDAAPRTQDTIGLRSLQFVSERISEPASSDSQHT